jgi:hypothetical protein
MKLKLKILSLIPIGLIGAGAAFSTTSCSKSGYTKDFKNFNELSKFANAGSKLTDSATFKDGYEAGLWFDQHANADFIAHVIALNLCNITQHELIPLLGQLLESFTELHLSIENKKTDAQYGGNGWFIDINAAGSLPEEKGAT